MTAALAEIRAQLQATRQQLEQAHRPRRVPILERRDPAPRLLQLPPSQILIDPLRFQFRLSAGADGADPVRLVDREMGQIRAVLGAELQ